ncbi:MAG TPA: hypothetical protein VM183_19120 [Burkholderiales bacterium]|nr:hypothetical protein [Burkholderiales bacterium]
MRLVLLIAFLAAAPCGAQDLPDPGRRLSKEEMEADPEKRPVSRPASREPRLNSRQAEACERSRIQYQIACGALDSRRSHSMDCGTAYAIYRQSCP